MIKIGKFTLNPFAENTYIVSDNSKKCIIIDPGCYSKNEKEQITLYIETNGLTPVKIINTHCHIDHILGLDFVADHWGLKTYFHELELPIYRSAGATASAYGIPFRQPEVEYTFLKEGEYVEFGESKLKVIFTPGHSPGSVSLYHEESKSLFSGDVLFRQSIGRMDLPGSDSRQMRKSLFDKLLKLDDESKVYSGHGPDTTIGYEKAYNPFITQPSLIN